MCIVLESFEILIHQTLQLPKLFELVGSKSVYPTVSLLESLQTEHIVCGGVSQSLKQSGSFCVFNEPIQRQDLEEYRAWLDVYYVVKAAVESGVVGHRA